jgi:hypothetical protein
MHRTPTLIACIGLAVTALASWAEATAHYPTMAAVDQYLTERSEEIALAKSAAPPAIANDAEVWVLTRHGYEVAAHGKNGFLCLVERGWTADVGDANFWNPRLRGPICFNAPAVRTYVPFTVKKTELVLAGRSKEQMANAIRAAVAAGELPRIEPGAMCYMLSKQGYLSDEDGHWHPHLMFFMPATEPAAWGAGAAGSPVLGAKNAVDQVTTFLVPVSKWSDGTADSGGHH